jgi:lactoylglutathione lyase
MSRPFSVLGVQQIAVGGPDKQALRRLWIDTLGLTQTGTFRSESENVDEDIAVAGSAPLNHIGLWIDDLHAAVQWLTTRGVRFAPGGVRKGAAGYDVCFIHPKGNEQSPIGGEGVLIELVQAPPEVIDAHRGG